MEKVFEAHIHHLYDIPLPKAVEIFRKEFAETGVVGGCFLSVPHNEGKDSFDCLQNLKMLWLKRAFGENFRAFAGLVHPKEYPDKKWIKADFLRQVEEYFSVGFDGMKMLEGYPSLLKERQIPLDDEIFDYFYAFMQENGYPITIHIANPQESWDISKASPQLIAAGRVYDGSYPAKQEITDQLFRVLKKFPRLKIAAAHFGFFIGEKENAERFMGDYENTLLDITPGGGQYFKMLAEWEYWKEYLLRYQDRIFYGTDFYAFDDSNEESWKTCFWRRPRFVRQFFETDGEHDYVGKPFRGVKIEEELRKKIYTENAARIFAKRQPIDDGYIRREAEKILFVPNKKLSCSDGDLQYILQNL